MSSSSPSALPTGPGSGGEIPSAGDALGEADLGMLPVPMWGQLAGDAGDRAETLIIAIVPRTTALLRRGRPVCCRKIRRQRSAPPAAPTGIDEAPQGSSIAEADASRFAAPARQASYTLPSPAELPSSPGHRIIAGRDDVEVQRSQSRRRRLLAEEAERSRRRRPAAAGASFPVVCFSSTTGCRCEQASPRPTKYMPRAQARSEQAQRQPAPFSALAIGGARRAGIAPALMRGLRAGDVPAGVLDSAQQRHRARMKGASVIWR